MYLLIIKLNILALLSLKSICQACDLFIASKCPLSPAVNDPRINSTIYCKSMKDHVDCINKKLKSCKNIQEYGPALETIKWSLKVLIAQGAHHACKDLSDKIKLPRSQMRTPSTRTTTTEAPTTTYINPNCTQSIIDLYCKRVNVSMITINEVMCKEYNEYNVCLKKNFYIRCQNTLKESFGKYESIVIKCKSVLEKQVWSQRFIKQPMNHYVVLIPSTATFILVFFIVLF